MANFRGKIQTDLGLSKFSQYRPVGRVRADTSAKPVLDASARTFEALGNLSPTLMKLAAYQVGLQKEEIRSEEQKRFASASLEERRRFAEGEALEEERQNPTFAGSNPWRRVIRQEIAGQHAAEVNLLSELERRRDSLTDHDRSIEDIKSEMQSLQAQYRPDSLYGGRAYDASAAAVVQQNEGRFLAIRGRKQEAATAEAITTGIQDQLVLGAEGGVVDYGAIRGLLDRYHSLTGKSGKDFLAASIDSVVGIYKQRFESGSISLQDYKDSITALYGVPDSMVEPSAEGSQVTLFDAGSTYAQRKDEETGESVAPKLRVQAIDLSGKTHFVVIPEDMSEGDFEAAVRGGAVYESFPTFVSEKDAQAFAADAKSFRPDGTQKKAAPTITDFEDLQRRAALEALYEEAESFDNREYQRNREAALLRIADEIQPMVTSLIRDGKTEAEIREEIFPLLAKIGEETGFAALVDEYDYYEDALIFNMIREEVEAEGVSNSSDLATVTSGVMRGEISKREVLNMAGLAEVDRKKLLEVLDDPEGYKNTLVQGFIPNADLLALALKNSPIGNQWEADSVVYAGNLAIRFRAELEKRAFDSIPLSEISPDSLRDALREQAKPENVQEIVDFLVADDIEPPEPGADVVGLLGSREVNSLLRSAFSDETLWDDAAGQLRVVQPQFYGSMLRWVTEYRETNPDAVPAEMVKDFVSAGEGGFKAFYEKAAETDAQEKVEVAAIPKEEMTPEQEQLFEERAAEDMRKRKGIVARREEAVKDEVGSDVDMPSWQDVPKWLPSNPDKVDRFREGIPKLREELRAVDPNFEESRAYLDNDLVGDYKRAKSSFQTGQKKLYESLKPDILLLMNETPRTSIRGRLYLSSDESFQEVIDKGETERPFFEMSAFGRQKFNYGHIVEATLEYRFYGNLIDGEPSHLTTEELATGMLRFPHREVRVPVPRAELHPHKYIMVADKDQLDSYTDEDWISLYENLDPTVQADLDNFVEMGAADNIPELLKGMQEDLLYRLYRIDLEDDQRTGPSKQMQGESPKEDPERLRMIRGLTGREIRIVKYHEDTIRKGLVGRDEEGRPVTVFSMGVTIPEDYKGKPHPGAGKFALIPGYNNKTKKVMSPQEAYKLFEDEIFEGKWPRYDSAEELDERSKAIHEIMDFDADHLLGAK